MHRPYRLLIPSHYQENFKEHAASFVNAATAGFSHAILELTTAQALLVRQQVQCLLGQGVSAGLVPQDLRLKAAFFDMDATVIQEESLVEVAKAWGKGGEIERLTERAMRGEMDFAASLTMRLGLLRGMPLKFFLDFRHRLHLNPGIEELSKNLRQRAVKLFLVSGGFTDYASDVARQLGFAGFLANEMAVENGALAGRVQGTIVGAEEKKQFVISTCKELCLALEEVLIVGDGANDIAMMQSGAAITLGFHPKPALIPYLAGATFTGNHRFFSDLLNLGH